MCLWFLVYVVSFIRIYHLSKQVAFLTSLHFHSDFHAVMSESVDVTCRVLSWKHLAPISQ